MSNELKFLLRFLPSFTRIGYAARRRGREQAPPDFGGQTWLVTGASDGLGRALTETAAAAGARVLAVARSADKLASLAPGRGTIVPLQHDLSGIAGMATLVRECQENGARVNEARENEARLNVLVNNVGALNQGFSRTPEGFETSYALNLLGQFVLTELLLDGRAMARDAAVISVTSGGLYTSSGSIAALSQDQRNFNGVAAYAAHKRAQLMLGDYWNTLHRPSGKAFYTVHPGWVDTPGLARGLPAFHRLLKPLLRSPAQGVDTMLWLAATRPVPVTDQVWFDRAPRPSRVTFTPRQDTPHIDDVVLLLKRDAARFGRG